MQQNERAVNEMRSELTSLSRDFAVHKSQTEDFQIHSRDRWREEDRLRHDRQRDLDEWREEQERKIEGIGKETGRIRKLSTAAVVFFATTAASGFASVLILLASR